MSTPLGLVASLGASVTWAFATTRYTRVSREIGSPRVNFVRALVATPVFAAAAVLAGGGLLPGVSARELAWLLVSAVCAYAVGDSLFLVAAQRTGVTTALSIASTYPVWATLWGTAVLGEALGPRRLGGMALTVAGVVWLIREIHEEERGTPRRRDVAGVGVAVLTSLFWAGNSVAVKAGATHLSALQANAIRYGMALAVLGPQLRLPSTRAQPSRPASGWGFIVPALVADVFLGSTCYVYGLTHTELAVGATLSSLAPVIAAPFAIAAGEEAWNARRFAAVVTTVIGVCALVIARA